jgi:type IV pilus assembly protein PilC
MSLYYYKVGKEDGTIVENEVESDSADSLRRELEDADYYILELKKRHALSMNIGMSVRKGIKAEDFLMFNQEMLVLTKAGLPITQSLDLLMERTPSPGFKAALQDVKSGVRGGTALSDAMAEHTEFFPELYCNSLRAGERTGNLDGVLERYILYLKRILEVKRKVKGAMVYPIFLIGVTTALLSFLLVVVVPSFTAIYADFQAELPVATVILMNITSFIRSYIIFFLLALIAGAFAFKSWYRTDKGRELADRITLRLPLLGPIIISYYVSTICRTLGTILSGGIPMLESLDMVARSITNRSYSARLEEVQLRVREGMSLSDALEQYELMSPMTLRMVEVGEATGALEVMLEDISTFYEDEMGLRLQRITNLIEPVIMLGMGVIVGAIVIAMYLPILQIAGTVS